MNVSIDTNIIIAVCGGIVSIAAAVGIVKKTIKNQFNKVKDAIKNEAKEEIKKELLEPMYNKAVEEYRKDFKALTDKLDGLADRFEAQMKEQRELNETAMEFRLSTLKGLIVQAHGTYTGLGAIETVVLETLEDIYKTYTDMGGNHFVGNLMEEIRSLPRK